MKRLTVLAAAVWLLPTAARHLIALVGDIDCLADCGDEGNDHA